MKTTTIENPKSGCEIRVRVWDVAPRAVIAKLRSGEWGSARDLGLALLGDDQSFDAMDESAEGDSASSNFALAVFEHALDWGLGLRALAYIASAPKGRVVRPFRVACARNGDVFIITNSGKVLA